MEWIGNGSDGGEVLAVEMFCHVWGCVVSCGVVWCGAAWKRMVGWVWYGVVG